MPTRERRIPFNRPSVVGRELTYISQAIANDHASAGGPFTDRCVDLLRSHLDCADVLMTTSCTDALELAALLLDVGPGDTVVVPSFTFVSTALAFARNGATIRFADIEPTTLGMCPESLERLLDPSVRAVAPVHYGGVGCQIDEIHEVLDRHSSRTGQAVSIIEDNAHGLYGRIGDRELGTLGRMSTLSFHETKNFVCGEGGALVLNDPADRERAHTMLTKGTNRRQFMLGLVDKYTWVENGSSFGLSDLLAAYLLGQLERHDEVLATRSHVWARYDELLTPHQERCGFTTMSIPADRACAWHMYFVLLRDRNTRDGVLQALASRGITATFHYVPLHSSPGGLRCTDRPDAGCDVTDDISGRLLRLPFYNGLSDDDISYVCGALLDACSG